MRPYNLLSTFPDSHYWCYTQRNGGISSKTENGEMKYWDSKHTILFHVMKLLSFVFLCSKSHGAGFRSMDVWCA